MVIISDAGFANFSHNKNALLVKTHYSTRSLKFCVLGFIARGKLLV